VGEADFDGEEGLVFAFSFEVETYAHGAGNRGVLDLFQMPFMPHFQMIRD
jgi:hypothetical protein